MSTILPQKLLFSFSFSFLFIHFITTIILAQPDFFSYSCETSNTFTANTAYERNLNDNFNALPSTNSGFGFFNLSTGEDDDRVNSLALCRGDITPDLCNTCLNDSIIKLRQMSPNQKEGIGYYDNCLLRYSNATILGTTGFRFYVYLANPSNASNIDQFNSALGQLLSNLIDTAAAGGPLRKFNIGNITGPDFTRIYGLVQCTPDLSEQQCRSCLQDAVNQIGRLFNGKVGGRLYVPMCNFRYETYRFFNGSTLAIPPPSSSSSPPPIPLTPPPPVVIGVLRVGEGVFKSFNGLVEELSIGSGGGYGDERWVTERSGGGDGEERSVTERSGGGDGDDFDAGEFSTELILKEAK